jgi:hypothetical protein
MVWAEGPLRSFGFLLREWAAAVGAALPAEEEGAVQELSPLIPLAWRSACALFQNRPRHSLLDYRKRRQTGECQPIPQPPPEERVCDPPLHFLFAVSMATLVIPVFRASSRTETISSKCAFASPLMKTLGSGCDCFNCCKRDTTDGRSTRSLFQ